MKTIPLEPIFNDPVFKTLKPALQFFIIQAVYKLCTDDEEASPLPNNLRYHLRCSESCYFNNKELFRSILQNVMPQIAEIKLYYRKRVSKAHMANVKKGILHREEQGKNLMFSDKATIHAKITPVSSPAKPYHPGQFDHVLASKAKESNATGEQKLFTDD